jgi:hypothetical protein
MKFQATIANNFKIKIPAFVAEHMNLAPGDLVEISMEHHHYTLIAECPKFTEFCLQLGQDLNKYHAEYQDSGGKLKNGSFRVWLVKKLNLAQHGLKYWLGTEVLEKYFPDGRLPAAKFEVTDKPETPQNDKEPEDE